MYNAIVAQIQSVTPIEGAKTVAAANVLGYTVIVGKDTPEGTFGVLFPPEGQLSEAFLTENSLFRAGKGANKDPQKQGFFDQNRRVRAQKFVKIKSEGFFATPDMFDWTGFDVRFMPLGTQFQELNNIPICNKYISEATQARIAKAQKQGKRHFEVPMFRKHFDTDQLRFNMGRIPVGAILTLTAKLHGTSGRTGHLLVPQPLTEWQALWNRWAPRWAQIEPKMQWQTITGTRNIVYDPAAGDTYYAGNHFRQLIHQDFEAKLLQKGETVYYEIVGFLDSGAPIMPPHHVEDKELRKQYGENIIYAYGCLPGHCAVYVYRITMTNEDGHTVEYSWNQVLSRCRELGLKTVPETTTYVYDGDTEFLLENCRKVMNGNAILDRSHIEEGACVRVDHPDLASIYKIKSWAFCDLEGIRNNDPLYVDPEEAA